MYNDTVHCTCACVYSTDHRQLNIYSRVLAKPPRVRGAILAGARILPASGSRARARARFELAPARAHTALMYSPAPTRARARARTRTLLAGNSSSLASAVLTSREHSLHPRVLHLTLTQSQQSLRMET